MFTINCKHCQRTSLVNTQNILSMHRSQEGTVAYVRCHCGKIAIHIFARPERVTASWNVDDKEAVSTPA